VRLWAILLQLLRFHLRWLHYIVVRVSKASAYRFVSRTACFSYPTLNLRRPSFSSHRCTDLEQSFAEYHICSVTSRLLLSLEDILLRTLLPVILLSCPWSDTVIYGHVNHSYLLTYYLLTYLFVCMWLQTHCSTEEELLSSPQQSQISPRSSALSNVCTRRYTHTYIKCVRLTLYRVALKKVDHFISLPTMCIIIIIIKQENNEWRIVKD